MIKQSKYGQIAGVVVAVFSFIAFVLLYNGNFEWKNHPSIQVEMPPPVVCVYTPSECVVEISAYSNGDRYYGNGIVISHNDQFFILTSSMIFTQDYDSITVVIPNGPEIAYPTKVIHQNDTWGLVALDCPFVASALSVELNDDPNLSPGTQVIVGPWGEVNTLEYINDNWMLLDGSLSVEATGMPVEKDGNLVGIIVGLNQANESQAIMVGNRAIREFVNQVIHKSAYDMFREPANSNILIFETSHEN